MLIYHHISTSCFKYTEQQLMKAYFWVIKLFDDSIRDFILLSYMTSQVWPAVHKNPYNLILVSKWSPVLFNIFAFVKLSLY